jgi:hypothetical protein
MEFFNKKEEVLDLQLTQYGKYLLSIGKLNPAYYTLHDDNVIYDRQFSNNSSAELQNEARVRIQSDTPTLKTQYNFVSLDAMQSKAADFQDSRERAITRPLATSNLGSNKIPSWNINALGGIFLTGSTTSVISSSASAIVQEIPQIGAQVTYYISPVMMNNTFTESELEEISLGLADGFEPSILQGIDIAFETEVLPDGSSFTIDKDDLILQIVEDNAPMGSDNFEVEIFEVETETDALNDVTSEKLIPMNFKKEPILIVNDILIEAVEEDDIEVDSTFVEYYFDLELDGEISSDIMRNKLRNADKEIYKYAFKDFAQPGDGTNSQYLGDSSSPNYQYLSQYSQKETDTECGD